MAKIYSGSEINIQGSLEMQQKVWKLFQDLIFYQDFLFLFPDLIITLPPKLLNKIQEVITKFVWDNKKKTQIETSVLQQAIEQGGLFFTKYKVLTTEQLCS